MTVAELVQVLSHFDPTDLLVMAKDAEGNDFSPLMLVEDGMYRAHSTWSGEIGLRVLTDDEREQGFTEDDIGDSEDGYVPCVILWPTN